MPEGDHQFGATPEVDAVLQSTDGDGSQLNYDHHVRYQVSDLPITDKIKIGIRKESHIVLLNYCSSLAGFFLRSTLTIKITAAAVTAS
ncbi:MAG: hypothetical protein U5K69_14050 [Balneolaceae bacterium]|nr:hypothetical protein [Balneolaceae bacterium]